MAERVSRRSRGPGSTAELGLERFLFKGDRISLGLRLRAWIFAGFSCGSSESAVAWLLRLRGVDLVLCNSMWLDNSESLSSDGIGILGDDKGELCRLEEGEGVGLGWSRLRLRFLDLFSESVAVSRL